MAEINLGKVKGDEVTKQSITSALGFPVKEIVFISQSEYDVLLPHEQEGERLFFIKDELGKIFYKKQLVWELPWDGIFADPLVGQILFDKGLIADPTYSTKEELALITVLEYTFEESEITKFPELQYCTSLVNMDSAFAYCESLTEAPVIPNSVTNMEGTFYECQSLTETPIIPDSVTNMSRTFQACSSLTEAPIIPNSVTDMRSTFQACISLTEAPIIPNSVTDLSDAFAYCESLNGKFIIKAVIPPTASAETFVYVTVVSIEVPPQSVQAYKTAPVWSEFADKIFPIE